MSFFIDFANHVPGSTLWAVYLSRSYQLPVVRKFIDFVASCWQADIQKESDPMSFNG